MDHYPSSSLSLVPYKRPKHDVFLSYSNEIGKTFVSHLKGDLQRCGFDISDRTTLPIGQDETSELLKAIEESWTCVVVFSMEYPFSVECLDELVLMRNSISKSNNNRRRVFPMFYDVEPSHVRSQQDGPFLQAFQAHRDNNVDSEKVDEWKHALNDVGKRSGDVFRSGDNEEEFVRKIVKMLGVLKLPAELFDAEHPVGIEPRAQDLISKLRLDDPHPSVTAVLGMSGSGRTTLVQAVYDRIVPEFDASCFIQNICYYKHNVPNWKVDLQRDVISRFNGVDYGIYNVNIKKFVSNQKVLMVVDDVSKYEQLQALGIHNYASFGWGSRILVTTTNKQSLSGLQKYTSYHIKLLNKSESSKLFTRLAYEKGMSPNRKFVDEIVSLAGGLPLVLEVWGRYFKSHESKQWPRLLQKLRRIPHEDVQKKLQVSYDSLSPRAKNLFLDIACFFDGMKTDHVIKVLEDEENAFFPDIEIQDLIDKGLVKNDYDVSYGNGWVLRMHAMLRKMGRELVRQENEDDPGKRSRLVGKDVVRVLRDCSGTDSIRSIYLDCYDSHEHVTIQVEAFRKLSNLRFMKLYMKSSSYSFSNDEIMSPLCFKQLKYLVWPGFPFKCLNKFDMANIVVIKLFNRNLEILWEGAFKSFKKLRILVLHFIGLTRTGSFIGLDNLEVLDLRGCGNLEELDGSIGCLQKLVTLNLEGCHNLVELDGSICCLHNLKELDLNGCLRLKSLPLNMIHKLTSLEHLYLGRCGNISNIVHELLDLPNILKFSYQLEGKLLKLRSKLKGPSNELETLIQGKLKRLRFTRAVPKFRYIDVCFKSYQQEPVLVYWSVA